VTRSTDTASRSRAYVAAVEATLSHLHPDQRARLTAGLHEHLQEVDDEGVPLLDRQPSPESYASELLMTVPGYEPSATPSRSTRKRWLSGIAVASVLGCALGAGAVILRGTVSNQQPADTSSPPIVATSSTTPSAPAETVLLPDVVGLDKSAALAGLNGAGFGVGQIQTQSTHSSPPGTVLSTSPVAGSRLIPGTRVNLVIATR
jgi:hypothetical protein